MIEFEKRFMANKGKPFVENGTEYHMVFRVNSGNHNGMHIRFTRAIDTPLQGIRMDCDSLLRVNGTDGRSFVFWQNSAPSDFSVACSPNSDITVRNVWDNGDGVEQSWHAGGAMIVEDTDDLIRIHANSTLSNDKCDDLVVELSWLDEVSQGDSKKKSWFSRLFS